ncbi:MAG: folate-binding protein YgfZ [Acidobacteria bacterium]|nr:folate-binding protein YgfZ [Acidobacteriota bacterium]
MAETAQLDPSPLIALREAAAFATLTDRAFLRVTGSDAARWLNGMVTNAIHPLAPGEGCYNFLLNAQGRIQGDCTIYRETSDLPEAPATFLIATTAAQAQIIQQHLDRFIIMDDVELAPAFTDESSLILLGPAAPDVLQRLGLPALAPLHLVHADTPHGPVLLFTPAPASIPKFELRAATATCDAIRADLQLPEVTAETLEALRILEAQPLFGKDIRDRDLPQETNQSHALHFAKGCYLGQEIVERIRSRGQVHRQLTAFRLAGDLPATLPTPLETLTNGQRKPAGELTSAALVPFPEGPVLLALGYARREALDTKQQLTYAGGIATPHHVI